MPPASQWLFDVFCFDPDNACLWRDEQMITLRPKTFAVLTHLVASAGQLVTKEALLDAVWPETAVSDAVLKACIGEIRKALGETAKTPQFIATVHRRGYRFLVPVTTTDRPTERRLDSLAPHAFPLSLLSPLTSVRSIDPLIEREAVLHQLHGWLAEVYQGVRHVVFVTGEAGIGKTVVVETFLAQAEHDPQLRIARGQCVEHYGPGEAYLPMLEALGQLCRGPQGERVVALLRQHAPTWLVQMPWLLNAADREALQHELLGATRERMLRELAEAVETLTADIPLVLVLEDLHWSDYATLDLVALLARRWGPARLLLLGTYRPVEVIVSNHPLQAVRQDLQLHNHCTELPLELLTEEAVATYLAMRFPESSLPPALVYLIHQRTGGNPLFLVNVVESLMAQGMLGEQDGRWTLQVGIDAIEVEVPEGLRQMIEQRIERLLQEEQRVLEVASVIGIEFTAAAVAAALEEEMEPIEERCERLVQQQHLLRPVGLTTWPDGTVTARFAFQHWLYQHVSYQWTGVARRVYLHQQIGARLEAAYDDRVGEIAAELAMHFTRGRDSRRAVQYLRHAAENATRRQAHREAIDHLTTGLDMLTAWPDTPERTQHELAMQAALGTALVTTTGPASSEVERAFTRARVLGQEVGDLLHLFPALVGLWDCYLVRAEHQKARELGEQLLTLVQHEHEPALLLEAYRTLGTSLMFMGELTWARVHLEDSIARYNPPQHRALAYRYGQDPGVICRLHLAMTLWLLGYADQARQRIYEALTLAYEGAHPFSLTFALNYAAQMHQNRREVELTKERTEALKVVATDYGYPFFLSRVTTLQGWLLAQQGQEATGLAQIRQGLAAEEDMRGQLARPRALALLAETYGQVGRAEEGLRMLDEALAIVCTTGERCWEAELYRLKGELRLEQEGAKHKEEEAEERFRQGLDIARRQRAKTFELRIVMSLSRLWQRQGRTADARQMLAEVYGWFTEGFDTADLQVARALLEEW